MAKVAIKGQAILRKKLQAIDAKIDTKKIMAAAAVYGSGLIQERAQRGKGVDNSSFAPYSTEPLYISRKTPGMKGVAKPPKGKTGKQWFKFSKKTKSGRRKHISKYYENGWSQVRQVAGRDNNSGRLVFSGKMMANMTAKPFGQGAKIYFPRKSERAKASGNHEKYNWFGFTKSEARDVSRQITRQLIDIIRTYKQ